MKRYGFAVDDAEGARFEELASTYLAGKVGSLAIVAIREWAARKEGDRKRQGRRERESVDAKSE